MTAILCRDNPEQRLQFCCKIMENVVTSTQREDGVPKQESGISEEEQASVTKAEPVVDEAPKAEGNCGTQDPPEDILYNDIVAESYSLATRQATCEKSNHDDDKSGQKENEADLDALSKQQPDTSKSFIQLESCGLNHAFYPEQGQGNHQQQGEYIGEPAATFLGPPQLWPQEAAYGPRVTHEQRYAIPTDMNPTYIQPQGVFVRAKMIDMRQHPHGQMIQGASNATMGYLRCVDQNMIIRPLEVNTSQPILIEDDDALGGDENEGEENDDGEDGSTKKGSKKKKAKKPKIKRPMNAFMVWAKKNRPVIAKDFPAMTNADVSVMLGENWSRMTPEQKQPYFDEADKIREQHRKDYPDWTYQPKPKRRRFGNAGNSFYFEVTKNTHGAYVTRHINDMIMQQLPAIAEQNGKSGPKPIPMIAANAGVHYVQGPAVMQNNDPSCSGNSYAGSGVFQPVCVKYPGNVLAGGVFVAQSSNVPTCSAQGNVTMPNNVAQRPFVSEDCAATSQQQ